MDVAVEEVLYSIVQYRTVYWGLVNVHTLSSH
jgi:hypothetical protein